MAWLKLALLGCATISKTFIGLLLSASSSRNLALEQPPLTSEPAQGIDDPDHSFRILPAVLFKLVPHLAALSLWHVAEVDAQAPKIAGRLPVGPNIARDN
ncbi:MAG: hypothetical protein WCQ21_34315 [Verrucomicrobiota bacterium]|jgi:hypothetical protein